MIIFTLDRVNDTNCPMVFDIINLNTYIFNEYETHSRLSDCQTQQNNHVKNKTQRSSPLAEKTARMSNYIWSSHGLTLTNILVYFYFHLFFILIYVSLGQNLILLVFLYVGGINFSKAFGNSRMKDLIMAI